MTTTEAEKKLSGSKVLVTGGAGLLGKELIKQLLDSGENVIAIFRQNPISITHPSLTIIPCDILDPVGLSEIMEGVSQVYHCAGFVSFEANQKSKLFQINVEGTANVVNACIDAGIDKLVHVSSVSAMGRIRESEPINEKMYWSEDTSNSLYGQSKYLGEMEVWRGIGEGLNAVVVNPTIILGGDNWEEGSSAIFKTAYNEFPWYTEGVSGFVDVVDVAKVMRMLMQSQISAERFLINGANISYHQIFDWIADGFGKKRPHKKVTPFLAEVVWRLESVKSFLTGKKHLLTRETARTAQAKVYFDNEKILKSFRSFTFTPLEETIERTCKEMKEKYHL